MYVISFRETILSMMVMRAFWNDLQKLQISFGEDFRNYRRQNVNTTVF